jgi:thymidylate synthase ThyX
MSTAASFCSHTEEEVKMIEASIVCDSVSPNGNRLTTFKLRYPKFIHGEFMTHRVISRNASSSRALPTAKLLEEVRSDALRAAPVFWGKNQPGMQAAEELTGRALQAAQDDWAIAADQAAIIAEDMLKNNVHKQIVNRLLEPFSHINVVATATEWDNFFGLRLHRDAQPEMRALAIAMWETRKASEPIPLLPGEWHLPFVDQADHERIQKMLEAGTILNDRPLIKTSVARCARVSYESFETGKRSTIDEDLKLYDRLVGAQPLHASPAEHQATPDADCHHMDLKWAKNVCVSPRRHEWGNFVGWIQYRKTLAGEDLASLPKEFV